MAANPSGPGGVQAVGSDADEQPGQRSEQRQRGEEHHRGLRTRGDDGGTLPCGPARPHGGARRGRHVGGPRPDLLGEPPGRDEQGEVASLLGR